MLFNSQHIFINLIDVRRNGIEKKHTSITGSQLCIYLFIINGSARQKTVWNCLEKNPELFSDIWSSYQI